MTRRERLMATLRGEPVDRPPVSFYELNGLEDMTDSDPFNIYNDPSWRPLIELTRDRSDRIAMVPVSMLDAPQDPLDALTETKVSLDENGSRITHTTIRANGRTLTTRTRVDRDVNTRWVTEHLLKDADDLRAWMDLPEAEFGGTPDVKCVQDTEALLGDSGIVMIDTLDPLCDIAYKFSMEDFTVIAFTEPELMHAALQRAARNLQRKTAAVAEALPGRLWRIYGPEYASPPYLPPSLFQEYVVTYDKPMVDVIQRHGGFARLHSHGHLRDILDHIIATGCAGIDPIEPPPQGDVELAYVRERYGKQLVLFGNLEVSDIENLPTDQFEAKIRTAIREGTAGAGRGFVLMPSACPYGRKLSPLTLRNYQRIMEIVESL